MDYFLSLVVYYRTLDFINLRVCVTLVWFKSFPCWTIIFTQNFLIADIIMSYHYVFSELSSVLDHCYNFRQVLILEILCKLMENFLFYFDQLCIYALDITINLPRFSACSPAHRNVVWECQQDRPCQYISEPERNIPATGLAFPHNIYYRHQSPGHGLEWGRQQSNKNIWTKRNFQSFNLICPDFISYNW